MADRIPLPELEKYLWDSADLLRSNIDAQSYKQYIFPLLFFKRLCDVYDEEVAADVAKYGEDAELYADEHLFKIPDGHHWKDVRQTTENIGQALVDAFRAIELANGDNLTGIFGDAAWTNKNRLPDRLLHDLVEHFSKKTLSIANCPEDELGQGYEYLIKKFADDSGHTAQEFYTNRTVVQLMTEILRPQSRESIYDPTCGSGGMLISAIKWLKDKKQEYRNVQIYGQEINAITSSIARMNLFLHGIADFKVVNADTLKYPAFVEGGHLRQFDMVLANPPYSISQWDRTAFENDKWGRNFLGTPPQGRADYAFFQHILKSMKPDTGRCAILFPHGVLFRDEEKAMRQKLLESDLVECVIGLGPNLFYNASMEACIVICRTHKTAERRNKVLFIDAKLEVTRRNAESTLESSHIEKIASAYASFATIPNFSYVATREEVAENDADYKISSYVMSDAPAMATPVDLPGALAEWAETVRPLAESFSSLMPELGLVTEMRVPGFCDVERLTGATVDFGDIVREVKINIDRNDNPYEYYVAGDHMDSEDLVIHRKGRFATDDVGPAFTRKFKPGQILYGSRRTYLKKVAVADFEGITANTTFVLETKDQNVFLQDLLPFLMLSDSFTEFSIKHSKGSTNPYILFSDISKFKVTLPPLEEQKKLAKVLWAMERTKRAYKELLNQSSALAKSQFVEMFGDPVLNEKGWPVKTLPEIGENLDGKRVPITSGNRKPGPFPYYGASGIVDYVEGYIFDEDILLISEDGANLLMRSTPIAFPAKGKVWVNNHAHVMRFGDLATQKYVECFLNAISIENYVTGTAQPKLNQARMNSIPIPFPPLSMQRQYAAFIEQLDKSLFALKESLSKLTAAQKALMNQAFEK